MSDDTLVPQQEASAGEDYESAFAEFSGEAADPVVEDNTASEQQADPAPAATEAPTEPPAQEAEDPLAGLPENIRKLFEEQERARREAEHAAKSQIGRVSALQKKVNDLESMTKQQPSPAAQGETPLPGDDDWAAFQNDYPQIASAIEKRLAALDSKVGEATQPIQQMQHERFIASQYAALEAAHPDWQAVAASDSFRSWLSSQPPRIQSLITSEDAADAAYLLTTYKGLARPQQAPSGPSVVEEIKEQRKAQLQQSAGVSSRNSPNPSVGGAPDDYDQAFAFFSKKQETKR